MKRLLSIIIATVCCKKNEDLTPSDQLPLQHKQVSKALVV